MANSTYFFHVEGLERVEDGSGISLPDVYAARDEAVAMAEVLAKHTMPGRWRLIVVNEVGERITEVPIFKKAA